MFALTLAAVAALQSSPAYTTPPLNYGLSRAAIQACQRQAKRQGLRVRGRNPATGVTGSGGILIGAEVILGVERQGQRYSVRCNYGINDRVARITPLNDHPTAPLTTGQQACIAQGQRQGLTIFGSTSNRTINGKRWDCDQRRGADAGRPARSKLSGPL